jgi:putative peptidoglycan lipid II flippase
MRKLININIKYNLLSLFSVALGFVFIIILGRKLGASELTDIYFMSLVLTSYLGHIIQSTWGAMNPYYVETKLKDRKEASKITSALLNNTIIFSILIVIFYHLITNNFNLLNIEEKRYLDIFIYYVILQNILLFNKNILKLEHFFASVYIVDIFVQLINICTVIYILKLDITVLAYSMLTATFLTVVWQFYLIFKKTNLQYYFYLYHKKNSTIYKNSIKLKFGALLYRSKDIIIALVFTSLGTGIFSLYSYANRFVRVIMRIVNAPIVYVFMTKVNYAIANKNFNNIDYLLNKALRQTAILYSFSAVTLYFILPYLLDYFYANKFSSEDLDIMITIFAYLLILNLIVTIGIPFSGLLKILKIFNYALMVNLIFFIFIVTGYFLFKEYSLTYTLFLTYLIIAQFNNLILNFVKYKFVIKSIRV